jgi:hypothetical protein
MKQLLLVFSFIVIGVLTTGCATIFGGSFYIANIVVNNKPDAEIEYQGRVIGKGKAMVKVRRTKADRFSFTIREEGYEPYPVSFHGRDFRFGPFLGDLFLVPYLLVGIPCLVVDAISGAFYKPDSDDFRIQKIGISNFLYSINLPDSWSRKKKEEKTVQKQFVFATIRLFDGKTIKGKVLENNPGKYIRIELPDNGIRTIPSEEIIEFSEGTE